MGQKCNPISNRLGIIRGWDSNWFGGKNYGDKLVEDYKIRKYLNARLAKAGIAKIVIERTLKLKRPELDAVIVGNNIARQLEGRVAYRRAIKMAIASTMRMGAEGIKILISGRLNGAEMARAEMFKEGRTPLHTFRADIDFAQAEALTTYGLLGIKVWICKGEVYGKRELVPNSLLQTRDNSRPASAGKADGKKGGFRKKKK